MSKAKKLLEVSTGPYNKQVVDVIKKYKKELQVVLAAYRAEDIIKTGNKGEIINMLLKGVKFPIDAFDEKDVLEYIDLMMGGVNDLVDNPGKYGLSQKTADDIKKAL